MSACRDADGDAPARRGGVRPVLRPYDDDLRAEVQQAVDRASALVSRAEGIKKFTLLADDFTEETGELTPTLKVKRHVVEKMYADQIEALYVR